MKVVYGHTDSIYVQIDNIDRALETVKEIENVVRKKFPNVLGLTEHPVALEFEKYYSALGVGITKNRNAGMITWEDGDYLSKPKFTMTGFTAKRVSETKLAKEVQTTVLKMWVAQKSHKEINTYLYETFDLIRKGGVPIKSLAKRSRIRPERFQVKCPECKKKYDILKMKEVRYCERCGGRPHTFVTLQHKRPSIASATAGVYYAHTELNKKFEDSCWSIKVNEPHMFWENPLTKVPKSVDYISMPTLDELHEFKPDFEHYAEQVIKKAEPVYRAMGWETSSIRTNKIQLTLDEWW